MGASIRGSGSCSSGHSALWKASIIRVRRAVFVRGGMGWMRAAQWSKNARSEGSVADAADRSSRLAASSSCAMALCVLLLISNNLLICREVSASSADCAGGWRFLFAKYAFFGGLGAGGVERDARVLKEQKSYFQ